MHFYTILPLHAFTRNKTTLFRHLITSDQRGCARRGGSAARPGRRQGAGCSSSSWRGVGTGGGGRGLGGSSIAPPLFLCSVALRSLCRCHCCLHCHGRCRCLHFRLRCRRCRRYRRCLHAFRSLMLPRLLCLRSRWLCSLHQLRRQIRSLRSHRSHLRCRHYSLRSLRSPCRESRSLRSPCGLLRSLRSLQSHSPPPHCPSSNGTASSSASPSPGRP